MLLFFGLVTLDDLVELVLLVELLLFEFDLLIFYFTLFSSINFNLFSIDEIRDFENESLGFNFNAFL